MIHIMYFLRHDESFWKNYVQTDCIIKKTHTYVSDLHVLQLIYTRMGKRQCVCVCVCVCAMTSPH